MKLLFFLLGSQGRYPLHFRDCPGQNGALVDICFQLWHHISTRLVEGYPMASSVLHHDHFLPSFPAETCSTHILVPFTDACRSMNISTWCKYQMPTLNIPLESRHHQDAESRWLVKRHATLHYFMAVTLSSLFSDNDFCFFTLFTALRMTYDRNYNVCY